MDFRFSQEEEQFRQELLDFLDKELPPGWNNDGAVGAEEEWALNLRMRRSWPRGVG